MGKIKISESDLVELKKLYKKAKPGEVFEFMGCDTLKEYAGYLIEYLDGLKINKEK